MALGIARLLKDSMDLKRKYMEQLQKEQDAILQREYTVDEEQVFKVGDKVWDWAYEVCVITDVIHSLDESPAYYELDNDPERVYDGSELTKFLTVDEEMKTFGFDVYRVTENNKVYIRDSKCDFEKFNMIYFVKEDGKTEYRATNFAIDIKLAEALLRVLEEF